MGKSTKLKREDQTHDLTYTEALEAANKGHFIRRSSWPEGCFVFCTFGKNMDHTEAVAQGVYPSRFLDYVKKGGCLVIVQANYARYWPGGITQHGWTGSSEDAWASDWEVSLT